MYWLKLSGADDSAESVNVVSIEIPILGIRWETELVGDTATYADGSVKEPTTSRITYTIETPPFDTNDYTTEWNVEDVQYIRKTINAKKHKWIKEPSTSGLAAPPRWADETNYPLTAFASGKVKVGGFRIEIEPEWDGGTERATITAAKQAVG